METYNYTTYCPRCQAINRIDIPIKFKLKPIDYLESTEVKCLSCGERVLI